MESEQVANNSIYIIFIGFFVIIIIGITAMLYISRNIYKQVGGEPAEIAEIAEQIAQGNLDERIDKNAESTYGILASIQKMMNNLRSQIKETVDAANVIATSTGQISITVTQLSTSTSETVTAVNETTATIEEVNQTMEVANDRANFVSESSKKTENISKDGENSVNDTTVGMDNIREHMEHIAEKIMVLSEQSQEIGKIITTVDDNAEQSNLLAVNAAIEATKAGEQGKGFSVVAQEIKDLAQQSKKATEEVRNILDEIMKSTGTAVMSIEQGSKAVHSGVELSNKSGDSIRLLSSSIRESAQAATQILASMREQSTGVNQVALAIESINLASKQNLEGTKQLEIAAGNRNDLGINLKKIVEWYKL